MRKQRLTQGAQELAVHVERRGAVVVRQVELEVASHVTDNEKRKDEASDGHGQLEYPARNARLGTHSFISDAAVSESLTVRISYSHDTSIVAP